MSFELRHLRHVMALARHGNFARAAESLSISQPALSRSIQSIEQVVGAVLFDRTSTGVVPTSIGQRLADRAAEILQQASEAEREMQLMMGAELGELRIGAGSYPAEISVGTATSRFMRAHPRLRLDVVIGDWVNLTPRVLSGELDLAVATLDHASGDPRFATEKLPEHQGHFFVRTGHPLTTLERLTIDDIRKYPLAGPALPPQVGVHLGEREVVMGYAGPGGTFVPRIRVDTFRLARQIVLSSDAVGLATTSQIVEDERLGRARRLPVELPWLRSNFGIIRLAGRTASPAEQAFCRILRKVEAELLEVEKDVGGGGILAT